MKWSKLKKLSEALLADSLKKRIKYHLTRYGSSDSHTMARAWITFDGQEIANFSGVEWLMQRYRLADQIREINDTPDYTNPAHKVGYYLADHEAKEILKKDGVFSSDQFCDSLEEYAQLSINDALNSGNPIIQGLALLDRRLGIRRLKNLAPPESSTDFVMVCYQVRTTSEGLIVPG